MVLVKLKKLSIGLKLSSGRARTGQILVRGSSLGSKRLYRYVDFRFQLLFAMSYQIIGFLIDGFRSGYLMLVLFVNGIFSYRLALDGLNLGQVIKPLIYTSNLLYTMNSVGVAFAVSDLKEGWFVNQISTSSNLVGKVARAAGVATQILKIDLNNKLALVKFPSSKRSFVSIYNYAIVGVIGNKNLRDEIIGKAGRMRLRGFRPIVRGVAMNPVDHPNGGRTPGGKVYRSVYNNIARSSKRTARSRVKFPTDHNRFIDSHLLF